MLNAISINSNQLIPSSVIDRYAYDEDSKTLIITFVTGMVYKYLAVPKKVYQLFRGSISKGKYFNYHIKDKFEFEKIEN